MKQSQLFYKTTREVDKDATSASHQLLLRAGFIDQLMAGAYTFLPLGLLVLKKIEGIIRKSMISASGQELLMPALTPKESWQTTNRWDSFDALFKLKGYGDKEYALAATHEEIVVPLVKAKVTSYKDLPIYLFQIQDKFRNEARAKSGILRTREFLMKDLYSFHADQKDLDVYYDKMIKVYNNIFDTCGLSTKGKNQITYITYASGGSFSKSSHEFQTITNAGEDIIHICQKCKMAINDEIKVETKVCPSCGASEFTSAKASEVGNIFKLGTKFSVPFDLKFKTKEGREENIIMGCYGIGLARIMGVVVEAHHDERGIIWPENIAPFKVHLVSLDGAKKEADKIYKALQDKNIEVLYDDREDKSAGEKFAESDLIGIPYRVVVSKRTLEKSSVELKKRDSVKTELVKITQIIKKLI